MPYEVKWTLDWFCIILLRDFVQKLCIMCDSDGKLLHFACGIAEAKCILAMAVCVCVCLSIYLSLAAFPHYCTDPDLTWRNGRECRVVVHCLADLQSVHGFRCCDNMHICKPYPLQMRIAPSAKCQRVLVLALWLVKTDARAAMKVWERAHDASVRCLLMMLQGLLHYRQWTVWMRTAAVILCIIILLLLLVVVLIMMPMITMMSAICSSLV